MIIYFLIYLNVTDRLLLNLQVIMSSQKSAQQVHMDVLAVPGPIVSRIFRQDLFLMPCLGMEGEFPNLDIPNHPDMPKPLKPTFFLIVGHNCR